MASLSNSILIGSQLTPTFAFDNASIAKVNGIFSVDVIGNELAVDTVTAVVRQTQATETSGAATLTVVASLPAFGIVTQPASVTAVVGGAVQFKVTAVGSDITYQWQYNDGSWHNSPAAGNKTDTLTIPATMDRNGYRYRCRVTSGGTTINSTAATLTVVQGPVVILTYPNSVTAVRNSTVYFTVTATGNNLTYQWQYSANGGSTWADSPAVGNDTPTLTVPATNSRNGYMYRCIVTAGYGIRDIAYGTPAWWYNDGALVCAAFVRNVVRMGKTLYQLTLISGVGLLENTIHVGGIYAGETFADVVDEIIGGAFSYTVAGAVASLPVYGWLPYDTGRNNLHQLLFATGVTLRKDENGEPIFAYLTDSNPAPVPDSRIAFGGTVDYQSPASAVEVTEHSYGPGTGSPENLFDNTSSAVAADSTLVVFSGPYGSLAVTGSLTVDDSGVNFAVVSGIGTLTGVAYSHYTRVISRQNIGITADNVKRVTDMYMVSVANSINVAKRVLAYFSGARVVRSQLVVSGEKCGDILALNDPYSEAMTAFLAEADVNASTNLMATCRLVEGYTPTGQGNNVSNAEILTGSGTWTVPDGVTSITVVLIGGGDGGTAGAIGAAPSALEGLRETIDGINYDYVVPGSAKGGDGGAGGTPGEGGRVYIATLQVTPGQQFTYATGAGGLGAVYEGADRTLGTDSEFGIYSSASGTKIDSGYADPIGGVVLAAKGTNGIMGGAGGGLEANAYGEYFVSQPTVEYLGATYTAGVQGSKLDDTYTVEYTIGDRLTRYAVAYGGFGGGAAAGANGAPGSNASQVNAQGGTLTIPSGGNGATASKPPTPTAYGQGGAGGNGGGGAGQNGAGTDESDVPWSSYWLTGFFGNYIGWSEHATIATPALPGDGSDGGDGADGCIEIYY